MKTSNAFLVAWFLLLAGLAFVTIWFLNRGSGDPGKRNDGPAVVDPVAKPDPQQKGPKPPKAGNRVTPTRTAPVVLGRIVDGVGKPVAGATIELHVPARPTSSTAPAGSGAPTIDEVRRLAHTVTIFDEDWGRIRPLAAWSADPPTDPNRAATAALAATTSDAEGKFRFQLTVGASRGPYRLSSQVDAIGSASANGVVSDVEVELVLSSGGVVTGTVSGEADDAPVAAARVVFDSGAKEFVATTDAAGAFRIEGMTPGRYTVRAGAKDRTPILDLPVQVVRNEPVKLRLPRGITMRVKALLSEDAKHSNDAPIADAEIVAVEEESMVFVTGKTNALGFVEFTGLPAGQWIVNGRVPKFVSQGDTLVKLDANKPVVEEEVLFETAVLTPIVVVDDTGLPVAGVEFYTGDGMDAYDQVRSEKLAGATDADGRWSFPFEFDGPRCMVYGFKKGMGFVHCYPDDYSAGEEVRLVMRPMVRIHGRVTDDQGRGVADATVRLIVGPPADKADAVTDSATIQIRTNAQGEYDFPFVPEGDEVSIEAETEDGWSDDMPTVEYVTGRREYTQDLRLEATPDVREISVPGVPAPGGGEKK